MNDSPMSVHENAWMKVVDNAGEDKFYKYGIYASRTLALSHPEVLLKADSLFIDHITTNRGYKKIYAEKDVHSRAFLTDILFRKNPPFTFDDVDFKAFNIVNFEELYPENYPILPYIDRRMLPVASTLKTRESKLTELEKAALVYQSERVNLGDHNELLLIYCDNEKAYIYKNGKIIDARTIQEVDKIEGSPVLIFNEDDVWYPLMQRDDTNRNEYLKSAVETYATDVNVLDLSAFEKELIDKLKQVTSINNDRQRKMAIISSNRSTGRQTCSTPFSEYFPLHALWEEALPARKVRAWQYYGYIEQILIRADLLSPISAFIASLSLNANGYDKLVVIDKEWLSRVAVPNYTYVWGHLWDECLVEYSVDESFRTSAGHCMVQGMLMSAILDLAGINNYLMEGEVPGSHHYVYMPEYEFTFDNSRLKSNRNNVMLGWPRGNKVIARFHHNGKFCSPIADGHYSGTFSPKECVAELDYLASLYGNKLMIYANGEHETNSTAKKEDRATTEDYMQLLKEEWEDLKLP